MDVINKRGDLDAFANLSAAFLRWLRRRRRYHNPFVPRFGLMFTPGGDFFGVHGARIASIYRIRRRRRNKTKTVDHERRRTHGSAARPRIRKRRPRCRRSRGRLLTHDRRLMDRRYFLVFLVFLFMSGGGSSNARTTGGLVDPTPLPGDLDMWRHGRMYIIRAIGIAATTQE